MKKILGRVLLVIPAITLMLLSAVAFIQDYNCMAIMEWLFQQEK